MLGSNYNFKKNKTPEPMRNKKNKMNFTTYYKKKLKEQKDKEERRTERY